jgi:spore germination protein YaaH
MQVIKVADDGIVTIELTARDVRDVHRDLEEIPWPDLSLASQNLRRHLEALQAGGRA